MANPFADLKPVTNDIDELPLRFGKHKGKTPNQIAKFEPSYIIWLWNNVEHPPVSKLLVQACEDNAAEENAEYYAQMTEGHEYPEQPRCFGDLDD